MLELFSLTRLYNVKYTTTIQISEVSTLVLLQTQIQGSICRPQVCVRLSQRLTLAECQNRHKCMRIWYEHTHTHTHVLPSVTSAFITTVRSLKLSRTPFAESSWHSSRSLNRLASWCSFLFPAETCPMWRYWSVSEKHSGILSPEWKLEKMLCWTWRVLCLFSAFYPACFCHGLLSLPLLFQA